jgi:Fe-S oxidoreductase
MKHTQEYIKTVNEWRNCPMANYVCAALDASKTEANGPKGKMFFLSLLIQGHMDWDDQLVKRFYECCLCNRCSGCGFGDTDIAAAVNAARFDIEELDMMPQTVKDYIKKIKDANLWLKASPVDANGDIGFITFGGKHAALFDKIAKTAKVKAAIVDEGEFDSALLYELGTKDYEAVVKAIDGFLPGKKVVVDSPHLALVLKKMSYAPQRYQTLAAYLAEVLPGLPVKKISKTVTLHEPCRLVRGLDDEESLRKVLDILDVKIKEMRRIKEDARCCGGPTIKIVNPVMSSRIADTRLTMAAETGATEVVVACSHCFDNFEGNDKKLSITDLLSLVAGQL